eukprot:3879162-Pyramimonas_sp.AAC.1
MAGSAEERRGRAPRRRAPQSVPARRHSGEVRADAPGSSAGNPRPKSACATFIPEDRRWPRTGQ